MQWPGETIWDTRVQGVTGLICARAGHGVEVYASATFALAGEKPPRVVINPNRAYAIADAIDQQRRFSINVMSHRQRALVQRLVRMRRREPKKAELLNLELAEDPGGIPYLPAAQRSIFCAVEDQYEHGDRLLYVARVLDVKTNDSLTSDRPLLFPELTESGHRAPNLLRAALRATGALHLAKATLARMRPRPAVSIRDATYRVAGADAEELRRIRSQGLTDLSCRLAPPPAPGPIAAPLGVCVVGTNWGFEHCNAVRQVHPGARLYVCGRDPARTARVAASVNAEDHFIGLDAALNDSRVDAVCLALPHDQHRTAVESALAAGKHVLVEKPLATSLEDADAMIAAAQRSGKTLMVAENMHFRASVHEAVARINAGDVGEPLYMMVHAGGILRPQQPWKQDRQRMGGGVVMDIAVHYVRALRMIMGEPDRVFATRAIQINTRLEGEDSAQLTFSSNAGWGAHMLVSWASQRGMLPDIVVAGSGGTLALWPARKYIEYYPVAPTLPTRLLSHIRPYWLRAKLTRPQGQRRRIRLRARRLSAYAAQMHEFLASIAQSRPPASPPQDARRDLEIVLACYASLDQQAPVCLARID